MGGLSRASRPLGATRLTTIRWVVDPEPPGPVDLDAEAVVLVVRPAGALAAAVLGRVRPTPADLADAATWNGPGRGAARLRRRLLLRGLAAEVLDVRADAVAVVRDPDGRPRIAAPQAAFASVARRGDWAALAVSRRPVGVDLEAVDAAPDWALLPGAAEALCGGDTPAAQARAFADAWSAREAYLKASGAGLAGVDRVRLRRHGAELIVEGSEGVARVQRRDLEGWTAVAVVL